MTSRLIILVLGIVFFSFGFYLISYQSNFGQQKPLNMQLMAQTFKAFNATKNSSAHTEHDPVIEVKEEVMDLENPTLKRGHEIYVKLGQCITCHGEQGEGKKEMQAPLLAGQAEWYTASQLAAFKNGTRKNDAMVPFLKDLTEQDFKDVAEYIKLLHVK